MRKDRHDEDNSCLHTFVKAPKNDFTVSYRIHQYQNSWISNRWFSVLSAWQCSWTN